MKKVKGFWIHWGMSAVMLFILAAVVIILQVVKLRTKIPVEVIWSGKTDTVVIYVQKDRMVNCKPGRRLNVEVPGETPLVFSITDMSEERDNYRCQAIATDADLLYQRMGGNTKMGAFVFAREVKIWNLVFSRKAGKD